MPRALTQGLSGARLAALGLLAAAAVGFWQAWRLSNWGFDGPGPGLFPQLIAGTCVLLSLIVLVAPGRAGATEEGDTDTIDPASAAATRRTFALYALAFVVLALGATYAGFAVTAILVAVLVLRFAEGRSWVAALSYGVICAAVGLVVFGWLLRVDLPESVVERTFFSLVR